ncbi:hypothetical protein [Thermospira aquatica]|nr:hypothetical protein [Thermospira aquatica]
MLRDLSGDSYSQESQQKGNSDIATMGTMLGFLVMMVLDVALS